MAAQAQTRFTVRIGSPRAAVVASYAPQYDGNGNVWISGYFNGMQWVPGYWVHRVDSRYRNENHYSDRYARIRNDYGRNDYNYGRNDNQYRGNRNDRGNYYQRDHRDNGRGNHYGRNGWNRWNNGRDHQGGRH